MKLTELLVSIAIFLMASAVFASSLINAKSSIAKTEAASKNAVSMLETDALLRKEIRNSGIPYWKNFDTEFETIKGMLLIFCAEKGIEAVSISSIYDARHRMEGVKIEWKFNGKNYTSQEFIKQRIADEKL